MFFDGVERLRPGHAMTVHGGHVRSWRTWEPDPDRVERYRREADYADRFRDLFLRAVHDRLRTPGPHGLLLSGGVDSGSIAAAGHLHQHHHTDTPIHTYSWAFETLTAADERRTSAQITDRFALPSVPVPADDAWPLSGDPEHGPHPDDPFLMVYQRLMDRLLARAAADGAHDPWSGDRGDPLVGDGVFELITPFLAGQVGRGLEDVRAHARWSGRSLRATVRTQVVRPFLETAGLLRSVPFDVRRVVPPYVDAAWASRVGLI